MGNAKNPWAQTGGVNTYTAPNPNYTPYTPVYDMTGGYNYQPGNHGTPVNPWAQFGEQGAAPTSPTPTTATPFSQPPDPYAGLNALRPADNQLKPNPSQSSAQAANERAQGARGAHQAAVQPMNSVQNARQRMLAAFLMSGMGGNWGNGGR